MNFQSSFKQSCLICGNISCQQAYDHQTIKLNQFITLFHSHKFTHPRISQLQSKIQAFYSNLLNQITQILNNDKKKVLGKIKTLQYIFLEKKKVNIKLINELCTENYDSLPSRKLISIINELKQPTANASSFDERQSQLQKDINQYLQNNNIFGNIDLLKENLISNFLQQKQKKHNNLKRKVSIRLVDLKRQQIQKNQQSFKVAFRGIIYNDNCQQISLNNKLIEDRQLVDNMHSIKNLKRLLKFELRHNKITQLSCRIIGNNLAHLKKLDIRGNKVKNEGVICICKKIINLNEFYICETGIDDDAVSQIYENLKQLSLLYMQRNLITRKGLQIIIEHLKLRSIGLIGNKMSEEDIIWAKTFGMRGKLFYLSI